LKVASMLAATSSALPAAGGGSSKTGSVGAGSGGVTEGAAAVPVGAGAAVPVGAVVGAEAVSFAPPSLEAEAVADGAAEPLDAGAVGAAPLVGGRAEADPGMADPWTVSVVPEGFVSLEDWLSPHPRHRAVSSAARGSGSVSTLRRRLSTFPLMTPSYYG
jgi:hypothetical protein